MILENNQSKSKNTLNTADTGIEYILKTDTRAKTPVLIPVDKKECISYMSKLYEGELEKLKISGLKCQESYFDNNEAYIIINSPVNSMKQDKITIQRMSAQKMKTYKIPFSFTVEYDITESFESQEIALDFVQNNLAGYKKMVKDILEKNNFRMKDGTFELNQDNISSLNPSYSSNSSSTESSLNSSNSTNLARNKTEQPSTTRLNPLKPNDNDKTKQNPQSLEKEYPHSNTERLNEVFADKFPINYENSFYGDENKYEQYLKEKNEKENKPQPSANPTNSGDTDRVGVYGKGNILNVADEVTKSAEIKPNKHPLENIQYTNSYIKPINPINNSNKVVKGISQKDSNEEKTERFEESEFDKALKKARSIQNSPTLLNRYEAHNEKPEKDSGKTEFETSIIKPQYLSKNSNNLKDANIKNNSENKSDEDYDEKYLDEIDKTIAFRFVGNSENVGNTDNEKGNESNKRKSKKAKEIDDEAFLTYLGKNTLKDELDELNNTSKKKEKNEEYDKTIRKKKGLFRRK